MSTKPGTLNESAVFEVVRDLRGDVSKLRKEVAQLTKSHERLERGQQCQIGQNREMMEAHAADSAAWSTQHSGLLARLDCLIAANSGLSHENYALTKALAQRALSAMSAPVRIDQATVSRLIEAMRPASGFYEEDLQRSHRECELPFHRNSGN